MAVSFIASSVALAPVEREQGFENTRAECDAPLVVALGKRNPRDEGRNPGGLRTTELPILHVDVMDDLADRSEPCLTQTEALDKDLERALVADMRKVGFEHVERDLALGRAVDLRTDELQCRLGVDEPSNQPGAGHAVDVHVLARDPSSGAVAL